MTRPVRALAGLLIALALAFMAVVAVAFVGLPSDAATGASDGGQAITVQLDRDRLEAGPGEKFSFVSTVTNHSGQALEGYVAHLNILTTDESVYVDPEDWSPERTQHLDSLAPGDSADLTWSVQAVTSGPIILYVSVTNPSADTVISSNPFNLTVGGQREVDSSRVMPLVMFTPAGVLVLLGATYLRRRRHR